MNSNSLRYNYAGSLQKLGLWTNFAFYLLWASVIPIQYVYDDLSTNLTSETVDLVQEVRWLNLDHMSTAIKKFDSSVVRKSSKIVN